MLREPNRIDNDPWFVIKKTPGSDLCGTKNNPVLNMFCDLLYPLSPGARFGYTRFRTWIRFEDWSVIIVVSHYESSDVVDGWITFELLQWLKVRMKYIQNSLLGFWIHHWVHTIINSVIIIFKTRIGT